MSQLTVEWPGHTLRGPKGPKVAKAGISWVICTNQGPLRASWGQSGTAKTTSGNYQYDKILKEISKICERRLRNCRLCKVIRLVKGLSKYFVIISPNFIQIKDYSVGVGHPINPPPQPLHVHEIPQTNAIMLSWTYWTKQTLLKLT